VLNVRHPLRRGGSRINGEHRNPFLRDTGSPDYLRDLLKRLGAQTRAGQPKRRGVAGLSRFSCEGISAPRADAHPTGSGVADRDAFDADVEREWGLLQ
jgi:hypothetical protein